MDSLMGAEIKQTLERNFDLVLNVGEIRNLTMGKLLELQGGSTCESSELFKDNQQVSLRILRNEVGFGVFVCSCLLSL